MIYLVTNPTTPEEVLFAKYQLMITKLAHEYRRKGFGFDDLVQEGSLWLMQAIKTKSEELTPQYAWACIRNAMLTVITGDIQFPSTGYDALDYTVANEGEEFLPTSSPKSFDDAIVDSADIELFFNNNLNGKQAQVLYLKYICGFSAPEISAMSTLSPDTIQRLESSALVRLATVSEFPTLTKELRRLVLVTAIASTEPSVEHLKALCSAAGAGYETMSAMSKDDARKLLTRLKKAGLQ